MNRVHALGFWLVAPFILISGAGYASECNTALAQLNTGLAESSNEVVSGQIKSFRADTTCNEKTRSTALIRAAGIMAQRAQQSLGDGDKAAATDWLDIAPSLHWLVQVTRADIAASENKRAEAAGYYNAALDTIIDRQLTPEQDQLVGIAKRVAQLAQENTMLAGTLEGSVKRGGNGSGVYKALTRGITFEKEPSNSETVQTVPEKTHTVEFATNLVQKVFIPIQFDFDSDALNEAGESEAMRLAEYISAQHITHFSLTGHTDDYGSESYNLDLSYRRASTLAEFLKSVGITAQITTIGKGETEPPSFSDADLYDEEQRRTIARRVELSLAELIQ